MSPTGLAFLCFWTLSSCVVSALKIVTGPATQPGYRPATGPAHNSSGQTGPAYQPHADMINGEVVASPDEFPFVALLKNDLLKDPRCGGTLVADAWILTAAHCVGGGLRPTKVELHRADYSKPTYAEKGINRAVAEIIPHPKFEEDGWLYDLALLKLYQPVTEVQPVALDDGTQDWVGASATALGWGAKDVACNEYDTLLRRGDLAIIGDAPCVRASGGSQYFSHDLTLCAGGKKRQNSWIHLGCGDSGGPLLAYKKNGHQVLVGVVSWSNDGMNHDVFMRTSGSLAWINRTIGGHIHFA